MSIHRAPDDPARRWVPRIPYADGAVAYAALLVTVVAFGIFVRTLLPSTGFWDTGEAQTVPATMSIFHPTGFPTYTLLGWLWSQLPVGDVAWRMNLLSAVCVALAAGLVVLITGHLIMERHRGVAATAAVVAGAAFAFANESWENATRADVHAVNALFVALVIWLCLTWLAAERGGSARAGGWLMGAALAFGVGLGNHPLVGMTAFGIAIWLVTSHRHLWRRWKLVLACAGLLALGVATYAYVPIRALTDPEPPLFYARPDTLERLRYLVFAEQFSSLFGDFEAPLADLGSKWAHAQDVLEAQLLGPGWLLVGVGASILATRRPAAFGFLGAVVVATVFYSMNFRDGDIDRYYVPSVIATVPMLGVAVATLGAAAARAVAEASRRLADTPGRRRLANATGIIVLVLALGIPASSVVARYEGLDQSQNRHADRWVASVHEALPPNAVVISWWSYSTPLWYHRWVLGERPDLTIIDERNILDDGYRTMDNAVRTYLGKRPVYIVPPDWDYAEIIRRWETRTVATYPGYTDLLLVEGSRR